MKLKDIEVVRRICAKCRYVGKFKTFKGITFIQCLNCYHKYTKKEYKKLEEI